MGLFTGKKGLILGVANDFSIAWAIAKKLHEEGAELGFTHLPGDKMERRVRKLAEPIGAKLITPCDVQKDADLDRVFAQAKEIYGQVDFVVHSIAYAPIEDLKGPTMNCSRAGFATSMDISVYSLIAVTRAAAELIGTPDHDSGGDTLSPLHVYLSGMRAPFTNAVLVSLSVLVTGGLFDLPGSAGPQPLHPGSTKRGPKTRTFVGSCAGG